MLRINVELLPYGGEEGAEEIGEMLISNIGTGSAKFGNYCVTFSDGESVEIQSFPREEYDFWKLILWALALKCDYYRAIVK